jgi:hypothetical protein
MLENKSISTNIENICNQLNQFGIEVTNHKEYSLIPCSHENMKILNVFEEVDTPVEKFYKLTQVLGIRLSNVRIETGGYKFEKNSEFGVTVKYPTVIQLCKPIKYGAYKQYEEDIVSISAGLKERLYFIENHLNKVLNFGSFVSFGDNVIKLRFNYGGFESLNGCNFSSQAQMLFELIINDPELRKIVAKVEPGEYWDNFPIPGKYDLQLSRPKALIITPKPID